MALADVADLADRPVDTSPAVSGSGSGSPWRWPRTPRRCCSTSRPPSSTWPTRWRCSTCCTGCARAGRTVVAVLHDLNQAARYADHLVAMRDGAVVAAGPPREILTADLVRDVFGLACVVVPCPVTGAPLVVPVHRWQLTTPSLRVTLLSTAPYRTPDPPPATRPIRSPLYPSKGLSMRRLAAALAAAAALGAGLTACVRATRSPAPAAGGHPADHPRDGHHQGPGCTRSASSCSTPTRSTRRSPSASPRRRGHAPERDGCRRTSATCRHQGRRRDHRARPGGDQRAASRT